MEGSNSVVGKPISKPQHQLCKHKNQSQFLQFQHRKTHSYIFGLVFKMLGFYVSKQGGVWGGQRKRRTSIAAFSIIAISCRKGLERVKLEFLFFGCLINTSHPSCTLSLLLSAAIALIAEVSSSGQLRVCVSQKVPVGCFRMGRSFYARVFV